ncbi:MAG: CoA pyrophosphatase [Deltaproteobacteria bacterium]|nr:CoA pyrophosphatase [Deltaproteobacteria bacterium]
MQPGTAPQTPEARLEALGLALRRRPAGKIWIPDLVLKPAAVLIPLFVRNAELWVLLTQRRADLRAHAGQISFPGGGVDQTDPDPSITALREAEEEVGIPRGQVRLMGQLDEYPTVTFFKISPFVGQITEPHALTPNPSEVAEVIELPLSAFKQPGVHTEEPIPFPYPKLGRFKSITSYQIGRHRVWGVTGAILKQLLEIEATLG